MPTHMDGEQHNLEALRRELFSERANVVPFVGAGLAHDFGFPLWSEFLSQAAAELGVASEARPLLDPERPRFEECADLLHRKSPTRFDEAVRNTFCRTPKAPERSALQELLPIARGPILTTNFDASIESVFQSGQTALDLVADNAHARKVAERVRWNSRILIKLHGEAHDEESRILTRTDYERHYVSRGEEGQLALPALLRYLFQSRIVLFVGCSLRGDRYLDHLRGVFRRGDVNVHYAVLERPDESAIDARAAELGALGIRPIWYPAGEHHHVREILAKLGHDALGLPAPVDRAPERLALSVDLREHAVVDLWARLRERSPNEEFATAWALSETHSHFAFHKEAAGVFLQASPSLLAYGGRKFSRVPIEGQALHKEDRYGFFPRGAASRPRISVELLHGRPARVLLRNLESERGQVEVVVHF